MLHFNKELANIKPTYRERETAEIHMVVAMLKIEVLDLTKPLKGFDIPLAPGSSQGDQGRHVQMRDKPPLPSKRVLTSELHPIAVKTRIE